MALFGKAPYERAQVMARAAKAEARGRARKALLEYRRVLEHEPENAVVLAKVAGLLGRTGQLEEARQKFALCAERYEKQGFDEKALAVYRQAAGYLPRDVQLWEQIAKIQVRRHHQPDAICALLEGRSKFRRRKLRAQAVRLLREVLRIEPGHFEATLDLARQLAKQGDRREAVRLCEQLCANKRGRQLRIARRALFWLSPGPATAWRWLRAALR